MYYISEFCCACLENSPNLVDIKKQPTDSHDLLKKLKLCVSELQWSEMEISMCNPCIQKLNLAFEFKQQCLKSAHTLQHYIWQLNDVLDHKTAAKIAIALCREDVKQEIVDEYLKITKELEESQKHLYLRVKPNTHLFPAASGIIFNNVNANPTFSNIPFELIPASAVRFSCNKNEPTLLLNTINAPVLLPSSPSFHGAPTTISNHNMFNLNNILHKVVPFPNRIVSQRPVATPPLQMFQHPPPIRIPIPLRNSKLLPDINISKILTDKHPEEVSVEIDPMCFDYASDTDCEMSIHSDEHNDWEELIDANKIEPNVNKPNKYIPNVPIPPLVKLTEFNNSVHACIKEKSNMETSAADFEDKIIDFLNVDHFMVPKVNKIKPVMCEQCGQLCDSIRSLHFHTNQVHKGKFPYSCKECLIVFVLTSEYKSHIKKHHSLSDENTFPGDTITLKDLSTVNETVLFPPLIPEQIIPDTSYENKDLIDYKCIECFKVFENMQALAHHKLKKHNPSGKKKYFIKGMKNAKCDICNREFSTQSYLQLHIKLHDRKNDSKLKVLHKEKYKADNQNQEKVGMISESTNMTECSEENNDEACVNENEDDEEDTVQKQADEAPKSPKGIKITINLKNIKQTIQDSEVDEYLYNGLSDLEVPMEVDIVKESNTTKLSNGIINSKELPISDNENCIVENISTLSDDTHEDSSELFAKVSETDSPDSQHSSISSTKFKTVDGKPQCSFCFKLFSRKHDLKRHTNNIHLKAIQYICHLCNTQFYEAFHLTRHLRQHNSFVRCVACLREFSVLRDLKAHINSSHEDSTPIQCGTCDEVFSRIKHLQKHMYVHDKDIFYKCHICSLELKESRELSKHLVEHSRMYSCHICHLTYSTDYELCDHLKNHSLDAMNERKYECEICHNRYKKRRYLLNHMNHSHSTEKDFSSKIMHIHLNKPV